MSTTASRPATSVSPTTTSKTCTKCGGSGPFGKSSKSKDGLRWQCKACDNRQRSAWKAAHPERVASANARFHEKRPEYYREQYQKHAESRRAQANARYAANPEKYRRLSAEWYAKNPEAAKRARERSYRKHAEKRRAEAMAFYRQHADAYADRWRDYYRANSPKLRAKASAYSAAHREQARLYQQNREARKRLSGGSVTLSQWRAILEYFGYRCAYCLRGDVKLTMDHVVAISRGGSHEPENVVPACPGCNNRKRAKLVFMMVRHVH